MPERTIRISTLFIALLFPLVIFLFLKYFAKNEYAVPPLYQDGEIPVSTACQENLSTPYLLPDSVFTRTVKTPVSGDTSHLFLFVFTQEEGAGEEAHQVNRVEEGFPDNLSLVYLTPEKTDSARYTQLMKCVFLADSLHTGVLVDNQRRFRGYYQTKSREDMDRLITELQIILKQY